MWHTLCSEKIPTYVFNYNSGNSWSIFILFIPMETGINTLQYTCLMTWWRRKCITLNVTRVYFIELKINIGWLHCVPEKTPTFVLIITLAFLGRFLYFLYQWKQEWILYRKVNKIYKLQHHPNCISTLPNKNSTLETTVADRFLQCVRWNRLFAAFTESCVMFIFLIFKNSFVWNFISVFWQKIFHIFIGFDQEFVFKTQYI